MPRSTQSWRDAVDRELCNRTYSPALQAVIVSDEGGRILEFNPAAERMFGVGGAEVLGRDLSEILLPDRLRRHHREAFHRRVTRSPGPLSACPMETTARRHDATEFPVELSLTSLPVDPPIFIAFLTDLSIRKEAGSALERHQPEVEPTQAIMALA